MLSKNIPTPSITQFELWASKYENNVKIYLTNDFRENGIDINKPIDFEIFKKWITRDHSFYLTYATKSVVIATTFSDLDDIGFDDNSSSQNSQSNQFSSYPTFSK